MFAALIGPVSGLLNTVLKRVLPAEKMSEEERAKIESAMQSELLKADWSEFEQKAKIMVAEMQGNFLQRSWRPITMLVFVYIIAHNYIFAPILGMFVDSMPILEIPPDMWDLLKLGIGGYIVGRSAEKSIKEWKK